MTTLLGWLDQNSQIVTILAAASFLIMVASLLAAPWAVSKLPTDYLINGVQRTSAGNHERMPLVIGRNILGAVMLLLGFIMLITPGPGLIMMLLGLAMISFPGKQTLVCRIGRQKSVFQTLNWMRARHQQPPLLHPDN